VKVKVMLGYALRNSSRPSIVTFCPLGAVIPKPYKYELRH
jgi:hypothetical protein